MKITVTACAAALAAAAVLVPGAVAQAATVRTFANCTAMHRVYPHGVGKVHARDHTSGKPVTTFYRNDRLYAANTKSDRDHDGVACEHA